MTKTLRPGQRKSANRLAGMRRALFVAPMGTGKTAVAIEWFRLTGCKRALVLAPPAVAKHTWPAEAKLWGAPCRLATGDAKRRAATLNSPDATGLVVSTHQLAAWWAEHGPPLDADTALIVDESTAFKSWGAKRTRALAKLAAPCKWRLLMTGTPTPNGLEDIWAQMRIVDGGKALGGKTAFLQRFFTAHSFPGARWTEYIPRDGAAQGIAAAIRGSVLRVEGKPDGLERIDIDALVTMPPKALAGYRELARHGVIGHGGKTVTTDGAGVLSGKLRQWAQGRVYDDRKGVIEVHSAKAEAMGGLIAEADDNIIAVTAFRHDEEVMVERFGAKRASDPGIIDEWNAGRVPLMTMHPASGGYGLNLQAGGSIMVWYALPWALEHWLQANARLLRPGQAKPVRIYRIIAEGTIDRLIAGALDRKQNVQRAFMEQLKGKGE